MTVREIVKTYQREIQAVDDLRADRAAAVLNKLSALLGNINEEIRIADAEYAAVLLYHLETAEKANRAKIVAECSPEYQRKREARDVKELAQEIIGSLKYYLRSKESEMRLSR